MANLPPPELRTLVAANVDGYFLNLELKWNEWKDIKKSIFCVFERVEKLASLKSRLEETVDSQGINIAVWKDLDRLLKEVVQVNTAAQEIMTKLLTLSTTSNVQVDGRSDRKAEQESAIGGGPLYLCDAEASVGQGEQTDEMTTLKDAMSKFNLDDDGPAPRSKKPLGGIMGVVDLYKIMGESYSVLELVKSLKAKVKTLKTEALQLQSKVTAVATMSPPEYLQLLIKPGDDPHQVIMNHYEKFLNPVEQRAPAVVRANDNINPGGGLVFVTDEELLRGEREAA